MEVVYERCAGLDVHKQSVVACRITQTADGTAVKDIRTFGTMTNDLLALNDWLRAGQVTHVAMESTGVYWKPVFNLLEGEFEILLVNARHIKFVPGRKTDVKDAQWIAELLQHGLLKASFIPPLAQRDLRELVRYRTHLIDERAREVNRVHKVLEDANLKLSGVATDIMGVSVREMLSAIIAGQDDPSALAQLARGRMRSKIAELEQALTGRIRDSHRLLLSLHLEHIDDLNAKLVRLEQDIAQALPPSDPDAEALLTRLQTIPGVGRKVAQVILAEVGSDMSRFPNAAHLSAWAGLAPGKNESAGRNRSSKTNKANRYLRSALVEAAHAAAHQRQTYLAAQFTRLASRRGKKRAAVAVAHSILVIAYHILRNGTVFQDLGAAYFDQRKADSLQHQLVKRLQRLGFSVTLEPHSALA
ncbi:MAG: IS110 family RNA-guided transposase [Aggregatilineales bacterium]